MGADYEIHKHGGRVVSVYRQWAEAQGIPIIAGHYITDLADLAVQPWDAMGGRGVLLHHESTERSNNCYVLEFDARDDLPQQQHLYEEMIYVLRGEGSTVLSRPDGSELEFSWHAGSLFAIPLNMPYQHRHRGGTPSRILGVTNAPEVMNLFNDQSFIYHNPHVFSRRLTDESRFDGTGTIRGMVWRGNLVDNLRTMDLLDYKERGPGARNIKFSLAEGVMRAHLSEFPVGTYKKAHRHGPGAHVVVVSGSGYTMMWPEGEEPKRYDWKPGSLVIPPDRWFHQHFNLSDTPARYLALKYQNSRVGVRGGVPLSSISTREGGDQIDYEDELPSIREGYAKDLAAAGRTLNM